MASLETTKGETIIQIADLLDLLKNSPDSRHDCICMESPGDA